jgi:hypothetical protein
MRDHDAEKLKEIECAILEAKSFVKKATAAHVALTDKAESFYHSKTFAAAKRASLDLTNALAKMRKSRWA